MKYIYRTFALLFLLASTSHAQLTVTGGNAAAALVDSLVGTGVTISNIVYTGNAASKGTYKCTGGCNLGSSNGIFLTSGNAGRLPTSPPSDFHSDDMGTGGDAQLNTIVAPQTTEDAAVLEFDFTAATDSVSFKYIFASEEYNDWVNTQFNDVFAFLVSGPGIAGVKNVAIVPGTTATPVSINNVNNGGPFGGTASGPCVNCAYYNDNVGNGGQSIFFDGFTQLFTAGFKVYPCQTYHMKFAIADVSDHVYDSGVFLEGSSFTSNGQVQIFGNGQLLNNFDTVYVCNGDSVVLSVNPATNYNWNNGEHTQSITITQANYANNGDYQCVILNSAIACFAYTTHIRVLFVTPTATITPVGSLSLCPGDSVVLQANPGNSYLWSNGATAQNITVGTAGSYTVTVTNGPNCSATSAPVVVSIAAPVATINGNLNICSGQNTTLTATAGASYLWSTGATTQAISPNTSGPYSVTVSFSGGCTATASVNLTVNPLPSTVITGTNSICQGATTILDAGAGFNSYLWSNGATTQTITTGLANTYTCTVTNATLCSSSASIAVVVNPLPNPSITGTTAFCMGGNSTLNAGAGYTNYSWSTSATTQTINVTTSGNYTVTVTDGNGCSKSTSVLITVNANPTPVISGTLAFCVGANTTLNAGAGYSTYLWSNGATTQTITPNTANTFTVIVTNANGCTGTTSVITTVNALPVPAITGVNTVCSGTNTTFDAGAGYSSYSWSTGATTQTVSVSLPGTYTVTVTNAANCSASTTRALVVNPIPIVAITGSTTFCQGGNSTLNAGPGFSSYLWNGGATTQTINVTTGGPYSVAVSNGFGCTASASVNVVVNALPVPVIAGPAGVCTGNSATLNAGAGYSTYQWSTGATTQTISTTLGGTYTVTVTNANSCVGSTTKLLSLFALPTPSITGNNAVCAGVSSTFDAGAGYSAYAWSTGATTQTVSVNLPLTYTVTVTDANGCSNSTTRSLTVNPLPVVTITGTTGFCQGGNSTLNAGTGFSSYSWTGGTTSQTLNVTTGGPYTVTVSNGFGCTASTSVNVVVHPLPTPSISGAAGICTGSSATINAGAGYTTYAWSTGATTQTISTPSAGTYTVTVTDAFGCTGTTNKSLVLFPLPTPVITGTTAICQGSVSTLQAGSYSSYLWSTGSTAPTINAGVAGIYTVTVTDANACSNSTSFNLTVNALPTPVITGVSAFCTGSSSTLDAGSGYTNYAWTTGATTQTVVVTATATYGVIVTDANGCTASTSQPVTAWALPTPVISGTSSICSGTTTTLTTGSYSNYQWSTSANTSTITIGSAGPYTVTVTDANGCVNTSAPFNLVVQPLPTAVISNNPAICIGQSTTINVAFTGTPPFKYYYSNGSVTTGPLSSPAPSAIISVSPSLSTAYTLTQVSDNYCTGTFSGTASVTVNPLPTPTITGVDEICDGNSAVLSVGHYSSYLWSTGDATQNITVTSTANYVCTVTDINGCVNSTSHLFTVNQTPVISFTNDTSLTCEAPIINFSNTSSFPAGSVFAWDFADGIQSDLENPSHQFSHPGNFPITLTITTLKNCTATATNSLDIMFYPLPVAKFVADPPFTSMYNSTINLLDQSANAVTWNWELGDNTRATDQNVKHYYDNPGKYVVKLTVTNIAGCVSETENEIYITPFFIPTAFSPNADGKNDEFFNPGFSLDVKNYYLMVFNRWGQLVFKSADYTKSWNGTDGSGNIAPQGTYVYKLNVITHSGKTFDYTGNVTLLR